jgi:hypothetical protein
MRCVKKKKRSNFCKYLLRTLPAMLFALTLSVAVLLSVAMPLQLEPELLKLDIEGQLALMQQQLSAPGAPTGGPRVAAVLGGSGAVGTQLVKHLAARPDKWS